MTRENAGEQRQIQDLWRENLWLRDILTRVAEDLERIATQRAWNTDERQVLQRRALRIRRRLWDGPPVEWTPTRLGKMTDGDEDG
jgi:hypothetical protein